MNYIKDELKYRIRTDQKFKKRIRNLVIIVGVGLVLIVVAGIVGIIVFSSAIIGFIYTHAPAAFEWVFNNSRGFVATFMTQDLNALLGPLAETPYVAEMKNVVTQYAEQLRVNPAIDFQSFQDFFTTTKNSLLDNQITPAEVDLARQFLVH